MSKRVTTPLRAVRNSEAPPFGPGPTAFRRGDHVELAYRLLDDLGGPTVFDRDRLWRYAADRGLWHEVDAATQARLVMGYAGADVIVSERKTTVLKVRRGDASGAVELAAAHVSTPRFFDAAPAGVAFRNGFLALGPHGPTLLAHDADHRATFALPFAYDPDATAVRWQQFLHEVFAGQPDVAARIACLEEWMGAALFGDVVRCQACLVLVGEGSNGKSVLLATLRRLFPPEVTESIEPQLWGNVFHLAELVRCRINLVNEMPDADLAATEKFKAVISGDPVNAAQKHRKPFTFAPRAGHVFACNRLPGTTDQSHGFWRRPIVLTFDRVFADHEQERDLIDKLAAEIPGIVARLAVAAARLRARAWRLQIPATSEAAKHAWRAETDQVAQFLIDKDAMKALWDENANRTWNPRKARPDPRWTRGKHLYAAFSRWARDHGHRGLSATKFGKRAGQLLSKADRKDGHWYLLPELEGNDYANFELDPPEDPT